LGWRRKNFILTAAPISGELVWVKHRSVIALGRRHQLKGKTAIVQALRRVMLTICGTSDRQPQRGELEAAVAGLLLVMPRKLCAG